MSMFPSSTSGGSEAIQLDKFEPHPADIIYLQLQAVQEMPMCHVNGKRDGMRMITDPHKRSFAIGNHPISGGSIMDSTLL